jgi:glycine cleavage system H protein
MLKFSKTHEWAKIEENIATVGITDYAQEELGDIVFIELPSVGDKLKQFSQFGTIESTKAASELYAPLSGEIIEVNNELVNNPQWINEDPQGKGWMIKIKIEELKEIENLLDEDAYKELIEKEKR